MRRRHLFVGLGTWIAVFAGQSSAQTPEIISVRDAWARSSEGTTATSVYLTIVNRGDEDDVLMEASSPLADRILIERLRIVDMRADRQTMPSIKIPASRVVELKPNDRYLAVKGLKEPLRPGQSFPLVLRFQKSGRIEVTVEATNQELGNRGR
jgi:copper(I)-binding protein